MKDSLGQCPLVSIIMPVYNVGRYLEDSLKSVEKQTYANIQLIIVNDGSTDSSGNIIKRFIKSTKLTNLIYIEQENAGLSEARNTAIKRVDGKYTYFFDSDDILNAKAIKKSVEFMEKKNIDLLMFCAEAFIENEHSYQSKYVFRPKQLKSEAVYSKQEYIFKMKNERFSAVWLYLYRTEIIKRNSLCFYPDIYFEDALFTPIAYYYMNTVGFLSDVFVYHRINPQSITMRDDKDEYKVSSYLTVLKELDLFVKMNVADKWLINYYSKQQMFTVREIRNFSILDKVHIRTLCKNYNIGFDVIYELKSRIKKIVRKV
ncbi:hypothetical protein IGJ55_002596 [Enterococcus sp. AZ170]|uniref:glycosyltransferase n=1 Tax=unclassified Enterococcus TaxID=2608891 RepID=UPI003D2A5BAA